MRLYSSGFVSLIILFFSLLQQQGVAVEKAQTNQDGLYQTIIISPAAVKQAVAGGLAIRIYTDFNCLPCGRYARETVKKLRDNGFGDQIRIIALPFNEEDGVSLKAAASSRCAAKRGEFWAMHDGLFAENNHLGSKELRDIRDQLGYQVWDFQQCIENPDLLQEILEERETAIREGLRVVPTTVIGNYQLIGHQPYENIEYVIRKIKSGNSNL